MSSESDQPVLEPMVSETVEIPQKQPLSEKRLESLAKARVVAQAKAKERREGKLRAQAAMLDELPTAPPPSSPPKVKRKVAPPPPEPLVIVEQDSDDEDEFEAPPGVLFVKRKRAKKPEEAVVAPPQSQYTPEMDFMYAHMFGGSRALY